MVYTSLTMNRGVKTSCQALMKFICERLVKGLTNTSEKYGKHLRVGNR